MEKDQLVRMKNAPEYFRTWAGVLTVPVGELGLIVDARGEICIQVQWPQLSGPAWTRRVDLEVVEEEPIM